MAPIDHKQEDGKMLPTRDSVRWVPLALLAISVMSLLAVAGTVIADTEMAADVVSGGGGSSQSASFVISDTFGQGPVGPAASGGAIGLVDGFWAAAALPVKGDTLPPGAVTIFTATPSDESVMLEWTNPGDADFARTVIRYSTTGYPGSPSAGSPVENGAGGAFPNEHSSSDSFIHEDLANLTTYYYTAFAFDSSYNYSSGVIASAVPFDEDPPLPVTQFTAEGSDTTVALIWTNPDDYDFDHTLIRYSTTAYPAGPGEGSALENGLGGKFYGARASVDTFFHTGLDNNEIYYYTAFAGDEMPNYAAGVSAAGDPEDNIAPPAVVAFSSTAGDTTVTLRWTNPDDADFDHTLIRYSTSAYPSSPTAGLAVENGSGGMFEADAATADSFAHTGLDNGTLYYYAAFAGDEVPNYAAALTTSATPVDTIPPGPAGGFTALALNDGTVKLRWTRASASDARGVHIRYSATAYPDDETEGSYVDNGAGGMFDGAPAQADSFIHSELTVGTTYYYAAFAYDEEDNYSGGVTASATPYDEIAPTFDISVFQNPYLTNHLDVFVIPAEAIFDTSLVVVVNGTHTLDMDVTDASERVYRGDYDLYGTGSVSIRAYGRDVNDNYGWTERNFSSTFVLAGSGGVARSLDGLCQVNIPGSSVSGDMYVIVLEEWGPNGDIIYEFSPSAGLGDFAELSILLSDDLASPEHLSLARVEDGEAVPIESYIAEGENRIVSHVDRLGSFSLVWRADIETPVYGEGDLAVFQNVPNPFVGNTTIAFEMPRLGTVKVDIVSVDGRLIRTRFDDTVLPGRRSVDWDGHDADGNRVASGVYLYRVRTDSKVVTKKMILLR
jgi:hypothetical protein